METSPPPSPPWPLSQDWHEFWGPCQDPAALEKLGVQCSFRPPIPALPLPLSFPRGWLWAWAGSCGAPGMGWAENLSEIAQRQNVNEPPNYYRVRAVAL